MDKFTLVYEFNKNSPLIVYQASKEIEENNIAKAIEMLNKAIEDFPYYPTPYFLLATALAHNQDFEEAKSLLSIGYNLLDDEQTLSYYSNIIDKIKREDEGIGDDFEDTVTQVLDDTFLEPEDNNIDLDLLDNSDTTTKQDSKKTKSVLPDGTIVTETLAEIYNSQGNYNEAKEIYEKLKYIRPEKAEEYEIKISELNKNLKNNQ